MAHAPLSPGSHLRLYQRPATKPDLPRNCVRVFPAIGGYLLICFDGEGRAIREMRCPVQAWEDAVAEMEAFRQRHCGPALKVIG